MRPFSLLIKPTSADCNIDCSYCFYKRALGVYPDSPRHRMSEETVRAIVSKCLAHRFPSSGFCFQGGEPTLAGVDFFRSVVRAQREFGAPGQTVANSMQTNGMLLNDEWGELFARYKFFIGISIDGPPELHDFYRVTYGNKGTHDRVMGGVKLLRRWDVPFNILCVLNKVNVEQPQLLWDYFLSEGFHHLQFIPCIEYHGDTSVPKDFAITPEAYGDFMCAIYDLWEKEGICKVSVRTFDTILEYLVNGRSQMCFFDKSCDSYFMVEHNGDVYPCDFYGKPEWKIGNINESTWEELADRPRRLEFAAQKGHLHEECQRCQWVPFCQGACPSHRERHNGLSYFCEGYKRFFSHTWKRFEAVRDTHLAHLMPQNQPPRPQQLVQIGSGSTKAKAASSATPGITPGAISRNAPCPCGSGRKYKHCCEGKSARV